MPTDKPRSAELFRAYQQGWLDGAAIRPMDAISHSPDRDVRDAYDLGYANGIRDRRQALDIAAARYGYTIRTIGLADKGN